MSSAITHTSQFAVELEFGSFVARNDDNREPVAHRANVTQQETGFSRLHGERLTLASSFRPSEPRLGYGLDHAPMNLHASRSQSARVRFSTRLGYDVRRGQIILALQQGFRALDGNAVVVTHEQPRKLGTVPKAPEDAVPGLGDALSPLRPGQSPRVDEPPAPTREMLVDSVAVKYGELDVA